MPRNEIILASASPRRRDLLAALNVPFHVAPSGVVEALTGGEAPARAAGRLALEKACDVADRHPGSTVLAADTLVVLDGAILGKPGNAEEARRMLRSLRNRPHEVVTGIAVVSGGRRVVAHAATLVYMRDYSDDEIEAYVASGDPLDKAGAYAIQHAGFHPVRAIEGCYCNVVGLPLWTAVKALRDLRPDLPIPDPSSVFERCATCPLRPA